MIKSTIKSEINASIDDVFKIITDNNNYSWRSDLDRIDIVGDNKFVEYAKNGFPTEFNITAKEPYSYYAFNIDNENLSGRWYGKFTSENNKTVVEFTEELSAKKALPSFLIKMYIKKQQRQYVKGLKKRINRVDSL